MKMLGERPRGATLADASLPPKAAGAREDKATSWLARMPARESTASSMEGGGGGRRPALTGRRPRTRCVLVTELVGWGDWPLGGRRRPCQLE
jgi:hypothetical protein